MYVSKKMKILSLLKFSESPRPFRNSKFKSMITRKQPEHIAFEKNPKPLLV